MKRLPCINLGTPIARTYVPTLKWRILAREKVVIAGCRRSQGHKPAFCPPLRSILAVLVKPQNHINDAGAIVNRKRCLCRLLV